MDDHYYSGFIQHDWKATPNLTLNTGLRWEYFEPIYNKGLMLNYPVLGATPATALTGASLTAHNHLWNPQHKNFSPKVGFAFTPTQFKSKMVVRGGFALAYNRLDDALFDPALEDGPGVFSYGICCGTAPNDFGSPFVGGQIIYQVGSNTNYNSYAVNPALRTTIQANGLPANNIAIEAYGANPRLPQPYSYLYSLETQYDLGHQLVATVGYQGSTGRHYSRLVNQNFVQQNGNGALGFNPFGNGLYLAQDDSNMYYNALNVHVAKTYKGGLSFNGTYTYSKSMDQVSSGDGADGSANQTNPQDNSTELGPSDFDAKHRVTALGTYNLNYYHGGSYLAKTALNGWQVNGVFTAHTGYPFTPVTYAINGIPLTPTSQVISPVRPYGYMGSYSASCSNDAFRNGTTISGTFITSVPAGATYRPGIGRNSFRGPCYQDLDLGIAKEIPLSKLGEHGLLRIQAQAFNLTNKLDLSPFTFNTASTQIGQANFGKPASASAGRVLEFNARVNF